MKNVINSSPLLFKEKQAVEASSTVFENAVLVVPILGIVDRFLGFVYARNKTAYRHSGKKLQKANAATQQQFVNVSNSSFTMKDREEEFERLLQIVVEEELNHRISRLNPSIKVTNRFNNKTS